MHSNHVPYLPPGTSARTIRRGPRSYALHHPRTGDYFEFGAEEYYLLCLLEKAESLEYVRREYEAHFGRPLPERQLLEFIEQLRRLDLTTGVAGPDAEALTPQQPGVSRPAAPLDPFPGGRLNFFFDLLAASLGWLLHPIFVIPIVLLTLVAASIVVHDWELYGVQFAHWLKERPLPVILAAAFTLRLFFLTLPCELFRCMACRRFGGHVRKFGIRLWHGVIPQFYSEIGDSLPFMSSRGCWTVLSIDTWCLLTICSLGVIAWKATQNNPVLGFFWMVLFWNCFEQLIVHWILFLRGNSYGLLCYALGDPKLQERALDETRAWLTWSRSPESLAASERFWLRAYGVVYHVFRAIGELGAVVGGGYLTITWFGSTGAVVFVATMLWWNDLFLRGTVMTLLTFPWWLRFGGSARVRWSIRALYVLIIVAAGFIPYAHEIDGDCRVMPAAQLSIRAQVADEIVKVHVVEGSTVSPGDRIVTLAGRKVKEEAATAEAELDAARAKLDQLLAGSRPQDIEKARQDVEYYQIRFHAAEQEVHRNERLLKDKVITDKDFEQKQRLRDAEAAQLAGAQENYSKELEGPREEEIRVAKADVKRAEEKLKYQREMVSLTEVTSSIGGRIVTPYLQERLGQRTQEGDMVAIVQDTSKLFVEVISDDSAVVEVEEGMDVKIRFGAYYGGALIKGRVQRVSLVTQQENMAQANPVYTEQQHFQDQVTNQPTPPGAYQARVYLELIDPPPKLCPNMTGYARIVVGDDVLWRALYRPVRRFLMTYVWSWLP